MTPLIVVGLALAAAQAPTPPQTPIQTPVFKGRLDVVRVDITVIENKSGKPVTGLTESDFALSENGVRQTIASFAAESLAGASTNPNDPANRRVFLFILNPGNFDPYKKHEGVAQFIRERLRPHDLVGVMSMGRLSQMTTDHERIAAIVDRLKRTIPFDARQLQRTKEGDRWGVSPQWDRFADDWMEPGSAETDFFRSPVPLIVGSSQARQNVEDTTLTWATRMGIQDSLKVLAGINYLRAVSGDKHIVLLSPMGFDPPIFSETRGSGSSCEAPKRTSGLPRTRTMLASPST